MSAIREAAHFALIASELTLTRKVRRYRTKKGLRRIEVRLYEPDGLMCASFDGPDESASHEDSAP